jgi:hypothetical protein
MALKKSLSIAATTAAMSTISSAAALLSPPSSPVVGIVAARDFRGNERGAVALRYRHYHDSYYDIVDVDGDRTSLRTLLDPPAAPWTSSRVEEAVASGGVDSAETATTTTTTTTTSTTRLIDRPASTVTELRSVEDYRDHVLRDDGDRLCVVRFSAPWCKVCRATNVAWERMAAKITSAAGPADGGGRVRFFSAVVDGADGSPSAALRDKLGVIRVPQGIVHHPSGGLLGRKVDLDRSNLTLLKKRLEGYVLDGTAGSVLDGLRGGGEDGGIAE